MIWDHGNQKSEEPFLVFFGWRKLKKIRVHEFHFILCSSKVKKRTLNSDPTVRGQRFRSRHRRWEAKTPYFCRPTPSSCTSGWTGHIAPARCGHHSKRKSGKIENFHQKFKKSNDFKEKLFYKSAKEGNLTMENFYASSNFRTREKLMTHFLLSLLFSK